MENKLELIVKESGLEQSKASYILKKFQDYFKIAAEWEKRAKEIVVNDVSNKVDMQIARTGRLFLRDKRIAIERSRVELKEQSKREGKAIDGIANVLKALIIPIEKYLDEQEHFAEIQEDKKIQAWLEECKKKEEEKKIAEEKAEAEERERQRLENIKLKKEAEKREKELQLQKEQAEKKKQEYENKLRLEKEKAQEDLRCQEEVRRQQQIEAEREKENIKEKAEIEKRQQAEILLKQQQEAERKQKEQAEKERKLKAEKVELENKMNMITCPFCKKQFKLN